MKNNKKTVIVSLLTGSFLFAILFISSYVYNPSETLARGSVNSQRVAAQKPKPVMRATRAGTVVPINGASVKKVGTREGGQPIFEVKIGGKAYVTGSANSSKALTKVVASCKKFKNCDNPSCHNVAARNNKNSKYYRDLNGGSNTPTRVVPTTPATPPIRVINTTLPTTILGPGVTAPLTLPGTPGTVTPGLPVGVTGTIALDATIFPSIVNEGNDCKITYTVDNAVVCVLNKGEISESLFDSNDGTEITDSIDVPPGTYLMQCVNDDLVPKQTTLTCIENLDTREN